MKISIWHEKLKTYVSRFVTVTVWETERPINYNQSCGIIPPLANVHYYQNNGVVYGTGNQSIGIAYRLPRELTYAEIPIGFYFGTHANLAIRLVTEYQDIADIQQLQLNAVSPVKIAELGDGKADWEVQVLWQFSITWVAELETVQPPRYTFNSIDLAIRRANADDGKRVILPTTPNVVDNRLIITKE